MPNMPRTLKIEMKSKVFSTKTEKQARVKALEREIDLLVYELYGLAGEEIRVVED